MPPCDVAAAPRRVTPCPEEVVFSLLHTKSGAPRSSKLSD